MAQPLVVAYGAGRDSTAMLIEMWKRRWRPDAILFANVGSEKRATYEFIPVFNRWLLQRGFPPITVVQYQPVRAPYQTLEGNMVMNATLPGAAFNRHTCTLKFKIQPQNAWTRKWLIPAPKEKAGSAGSRSVRSKASWACGKAMSWVQVRPLPVKCSGKVCWWTSSGRSSRACKWHTAGAPLT